MELLELHNCPEFLDVCCKVLNAEWSRSYAAREHSLKKSNSDLPVSLILVERKESSTEFLGHAKLTKVVGKPHSCIVESVIIVPQKRGRGLGKLLMIQVEDYARRKGFTHCHLNTFDKVEFYKHLGYVESTPVCIVSARKATAHHSPRMHSSYLCALKTWISEVLETVAPSCKLLFGSSTHTAENRGQAQASNDSKCCHGDNNDSRLLLPPVPPAPPPPPPPPPLMKDPVLQSDGTDCPVVKVWMVKVLS
ncbi:N-alpha-acetyltransferase 80-like isoform X1 [Ornithodoros turicata]|uniref:N-alpha-acetyltransferase 80-like isoform X1 n=1 Tax=Ornithodoros turicata TaxID=34597 RepID=UPI003138B818